MAGRSDDDLREIPQYRADREVARLLGISVAHSCLLRIVNDREGGCPQDVLLRPERVVGDQAQRVLAFWLRLDAMTPKRLAAAWDAARDAAWATTEIQGATLMRERGQPFVFLPMFGITDPSELDQ